MFIFQYQSALVQLILDDFDEGNVISDNEDTYLERIGYLEIIRNQLNRRLKAIGPISDQDILDPQIHKLYKRVYQAIQSAVFPGEEDSPPWIFHATAKIVKINEQGAFTILIGDLRMSYNDIVKKLRPGVIVSFDVYPSHLFPDIFKNVKVIDPEISANTAMKLGYDVEALHAKVVGSLPKNSPTRYDEYSYTIVETMLGQTQIVGIPWIIEDTINIFKSQNALIVVRNVTNDDLQKLNKILIGNGYQDFEIKIVE